MEGCGHRIGIFWARTKRTCSLERFVEKGGKVVAMVLVYWRERELERYERVVEEKGWKVVAIVLVYFGHEPNGLALWSALLRREGRLWPWYWYIDAEGNSSAMRHRIQGIPSTTMYDAGVQRA